MLLFLPLCFLINQSCGEGLESWTRGLSSLARADRNQYAAYDHSSTNSYPECVWVFGGNDADNLYCYNMTTETAIYWDDLDPSSSYSLLEGSPPASLIISNEANDYLYVLSRYGYLLRYDLKNKELVLLDDTLYQSDFYYGCMAMNPSNSDELVMADGYLSSMFAIYTISTDTFTFGKDLNTAVLRPTCVMIDNDYFNVNPYWYIFGGETTAIQRIDINSSDLANEKWFVLITELSVSNSNCDVNDWSSLYASGAVLFNNLIYMIGGYDASDSSDNSCIVAFDLDDNSVSYFGHFPITISRYAITLCYVFWLPTFCKIVVFL